MLWRNARGYDREAKQKYGVGANGASDLIGYAMTRITPDMVGKTVPIFMAVEVKTGKGKTTLEQENFIDHVLQRGGFAGVARCVADLKNILDKG